MYNYLLEHALRNVWCAPQQDNQVVISGALITHTEGALNKVRAYGRDIALPTLRERYHVYQIGQLQPSILGIQDDGILNYTESWTTFAETINDEKVWVDVCTEKGVQMPRYHTYFIYTKERGLLLAIPIDTVVRTDTQKIFLRVYSNQYFETLESDAKVDCLFTYGCKITSKLDILDFEAIVKPYKAKPGHIYYYCNGFLVNEASLISLSINDIVEFVYDSSVKLVIDIPFSNITSFESKVDDLRKYLVRHASLPSNTISFYDDIEFYVASAVPKYGFKALYYLRTKLASARMVTHRDYSLPVEYVENVRTALSDKLSISKTDDQYLRVHVRQACIARPLIYDNNRIFELYKLSEDKIAQSLTGINAGLDIWNASYLEAAMYSKLMSDMDITIVKVQEAYGYNAASVYLGYTPQLVDTSDPNLRVHVPYALAVNGCTAYEYDQDGYLLSFHYHSAGMEYLCRDKLTRLVEFVYGKGTGAPEVIFGKDSLAIPANCEYRVYMAFATDVNVTTEWKDITGSKHYSVLNNVLKWNNLLTDQLLMIRTDRTHLAYTMDVDTVDGILFFTLAEIENRGKGLANHTLGVPGGVLDVWVNGKALIQDVGYYVDFPTVYITDRASLNQPTSEKQQVTVRFHGFCKSDLTLDPNEDTGYIQHGYLSRNYRFDIRDDKVLRIVVGGRTLHRNALEFAEDHDGVHVTHELNGQPYQLKDIIVPVNYALPVDTYQYRDASIAIDKKVADYMTIKLPEPSKNAVSSVATRYCVYTPFLQKLIADMYQGHFDNERIYKAWTNMDLLDLCKSYEYLLKFDPIKNGIDREFVNVIPHNFANLVDLNVYQIRFLSAVVKTYYDNEIDVTSFVRMVS